MDKFVCQQELFELINEENAKCRFPSPLLAVYETLHQSILCSNWLQAIQQEEACKVWFDLS